ncbi:chromosomal replication initiator protein DnaA, partial [Neisseria sp. P0016.S005]
LKSQFAAKIDAVRAELVTKQAAFAFNPGVGAHYEMAAQTVAPLQVQEVIEVEDCVETDQMPLQTSAPMEEDMPSETV